MRTLIKYLFVIALTFISSSALYAQQDSQKNKNQDYQIYLKRPAKAIRLLMYEKNFTPIQGKLSEDRKSIIIKNYETGSKVHVKVEYEDGTIDEFVKSPCYIDPVIVFNLPPQVPGCYDSVFFFNLLPQIHRFFIC